MILFPTWEKTDGCTMKEITIVSCLAQERTIYKYINCSQKMKILPDKGMHLYSFHFQFL